jgi:endonuclease-3
VNRLEKARLIQSTLEKLYPKPAVPLDHKDPFTLLIAVLLSAQSTDKKVNEITPALFALADSPHLMAALDVQVIRGAIRQIGLANTKANAIKNLSQQILDEHQGLVPQSFDGLEGLPGVGHKTASVVMAQAFKVAAFPVDTHIHRLAARWGLSAAKNVVQTERDLKALFAEASWNSLHLQIIFFGREHCPARFHDLEMCPICSWASTKKRQRAEQQSNAKARRRG